ISKKGRGAGEYVSISDFHINRYTGNLEILSEFGNINIYDPMGDEFLETIKLPFSAVHYFCNISPDIYCFYSSAQGGEIVFYSKAKSQKIGNSNYKLPEWLRSTIYSPSKSPFYIYKDSVCFEQLYNGDVSTITEHDLDLK